MVFENRLAKIGKGSNINLYVKNDKEIEVFLLSNLCIKKILNISNESFGLKVDGENFSYDEILKISDNLYISRTNNEIRILKTND